MKNAIKEELGYMLSLSLLLVGMIVIAIPILLGAYALVIKNEDAFVYLSTYVSAFMGALIFKYVPQTSSIRSRVRSYIPVSVVTGTLLCAEYQILKTLTSTPNAIYLLCMTAIGLVILFNQGNVDV